MSSKRADHEVKHVTLQWAAVYRACRKTWFQRSLLLLHKYRIVPGRARLADNNLLQYIQIVWKQAIGNKAIHLLDHMQLQFFHFFLLAVLITSRSDGLSAPGSSVISWSAACSVKKRSRLCWFCQKQYYY